MPKASTILFCPSQCIIINLICYKVLQQYSSTIYLSYGSTKIQCPTLSWNYSGKRGKIRNSDPYHSNGTLTQKSIQWFRQQINDLISIQAKHCTDMEKKLQHWIKESQTHHITRASPYNPHRIWKILQTDSSHSQGCNRAALMRFSTTAKQKQHLNPTVKY